MHCFPSLHFCLELPLFSACRKGMERLAVAFAIAMGVGHNSFLHVPPGSGPGTGMQPAWGCALFWVCKGCSANRLGGKRYPWWYTISTAHTAKLHGNRAQSWQVGVTRDKMIKNSAWMHTFFQKADLSAYTKVNHLYAFTPGLNTESQRE